MTTRQVVLDLETTGLEPQLGHRIIEIGCLELRARRPTGRRFHEYINPERGIDPGAVEIHGIRSEDLRDKPRFSQVLDPFLEFVRGAELIIHNAAFDVGFLNHEMALVDTQHAPLESLCRVLDTLALARQLHPGQRNNLDALCKRYNVDNSQRKLHGALLDAEILADVYLAMTGGQATLWTDAGATVDAHAPAAMPQAGATQRAGLVIAVSATEHAAHMARLQAIAAAAGEAGCLWLEQQEV